MEHILDYQPYNCRGDYVETEVSNVDYKEM